MKRPGEAVLEAARRAAADALHDARAAGENRSETGAAAADAAIRVITHDLLAMLNPELYPGYDPQHVYWDDHDPDDPRREPFQWSADTIEWVSGWCERLSQEVELECNATRDLCTIAFQPESSDTAAHHYRQLASAEMVVTVVAADGPRVDAELLDVIVGEDGQHKARFARWSDELGGGDRDQVVVLDIYDEIERIEVV